MNDNKKELDDIKNKLSIDQISSLLEELGGEPQINGNIIKSKTICHCGDSHKLYYYENTKLFKCYTQCAGDSFDIFELILKINTLKGDDEWNLPKSLSFVKKYFNLNDDDNNNFIFSENKLKDWSIIQKYENNSSNLEETEQIIEMKEYNNDILKFLPKPKIIPWIEEGITEEVMNKYGICYNPSNQSIIIPHYDINNILVGVRERTLIKEDEVYGKYKPAILNGKMYNHPLGFNLYNLNNSKNAIKLIKKAIVFEGEKSCLKYASYFGIDNDISVACCGSSLIKYQVQTLLNLGVEEIVIAFDKQFKEIGDDEWKKWTKKLIQINDKYSSQVEITFLFDKKDLLKYKMSPIDNGKETFLKLFKERIKI